MSNPSVILLERENDSPKCKIAALKKNFEDFVSMCSVTLNSFNMNIWRTPWQADISCVTVTLLVLLQSPVQSTRIVHSTSSLAVALKVDVKHYPGRKFRTMSPLWSYSTLGLDAQLCAATNVYRMWWNVEWRHSYTFKSIFNVFKHILFNTCVVH